MPPKEDPSKRERQSSQRLLATKPQPALDPSAAQPPSEGEISSLEDLSFINITAPQQSRTQTARRFVRAQVMKTFARGRREEKARAETAIQDQTSSTGIKIRGRTGRPGPSSSGRRKEPLPKTTTNPAAQVIRMTWPVIADPESEELKAHCFSSSFRANYPLYMISLLADRPDAEMYPFSIDIDSPADFPDPDVGSNVLFQLAEGSASLAHALLTVSASHLSLRQINKSRNDRQVLYHRSRALELLKNAIQNAGNGASLEAMTTAAVLASLELMMGDYTAWTIHILGVSRLVEAEGGILRLPEEISIQRLILWPDQMGALFMNIKPAFRHSAVPSSASGLWRQISQDNPTAIEVHQAFQTMHAAQLLPGDLVSILTDITILLSLGAGTILAQSQISLTDLLHLRDSLIHRLLDLAPQSDGGYELSSPEQTVRLTLLLLTLERLFSPVLPSAYFQLTHMVADRLAETLGTSLTQNPEDWLGHEWVTLWVCFVGTTASSNNSRPRGHFVKAAAGLVRDERQIMGELEVGLRGFVPSLEVYGEEVVEGFIEDLWVEIGGRGGE